MKRAAYFLLMSLLFIPIVTTYCWILGSCEQYTSISAAKEQDILTKVEINEINPEFIKITKAKNLSYIPTVYLSFEGDFADYILHINPVKLVNEEYIIPINFGLNPNNISKMFSKNEKIKGIVEIKHFNEFIDIRRNVVFTREFILEKVYMQINNIDKTQMSKIESKFDIKFKELHYKDMLFQINNIVNP